MTEGEQALIIVTSVVAAANLFAAVAAWWNAKASRQAASLARREFALSRSPALRLERVTVQHENGRLWMRGEIRETSGHRAYLHAGRLILEVVEPVELDTGEMSTGHVAYKDSPNLGPRRVYAGRPCRVNSSVTVDDIMPPREVAITIVYTYSADHTHWHRETWGADVMVSVGPGTTIETRVSHSFYHDRYDNEDGCLQKAAKWFHRIRTEMGG